jgi:type II secretory pathway pseudopilin PulG
MVISARRTHRKDEPGFTLVELLLTVALLLGLLSVLVFNFWTLKSGAGLEEGARQFEALARFAGAHAANTGRAVQFQFEEASTNEIYAAGPQLRVVREVDPVGQPGVFEDLREATPFLEALRETIKIAEVKAAQRPANQGTNEVTTSEDFFALPPPITFFPDGSSDSADIVLASRDPDDLREMIIHLSGVTGTIRTEMRILDDFVPVEWQEDEMQPAATAVTPAKETAKETSVAMPDFEDPITDPTTLTNKFNDDWP